MSDEDETSTPPTTTGGRGPLSPAPLSPSGSVCWAAHMSSALVSVLAMVLAGKWFAPLLPLSLSRWAEGGEWKPFAAVGGSLIAMLVAIAAPTSFHDLAEIAKKRIGK